MYLYELLKGSKKLQCPECQQKTFVPYVYTESQEIIDATKFGRCDRENSCGYQHYPSSEDISPISHGSSRAAIQKAIKQIFPSGEVYSSIIDRTRTCVSPFHHYCRSLGIPSEHLLKWNVYTDGDNEEKTAFIFKNKGGKICNIKWFRYLDNGHRDKKFKAYSLSQPKKSAQNKDGNSEEKYLLCLFGEHLLDPEKKKEVCLVESEKTAVIASYFYPQFDWVSCGSAHGLGVPEGLPGDFKIKALYNRKVIWLCDGDKAGRDNKSIKILKKYGINHCSVDLYPDRNDGYDLSDDIDQNRKPKIVFSIPTEHQEQNNEPDKDEEYLKEKSKEYLRIGTKYYRVLKVPLASGQIQTIEKPWTRQTIVEDHGKRIIPFVKKYIDFCNVPSHTDYQASVNGYFNRYHPLTNKPAPGNCDQTFSFLMHIFEEHFELALDYIKLLYENPVQKLPILCLVSNERNTGKSTFLKWLNAVFDLNMTVNTNQDFESNFNADWTRKLIIAIDETFIDKKVIAERIKFLSTTNNFKEESKGVDKLEIEFFGKFIFCSNNEENFLPIDEQEQRYWVRKVNVLEKDNPDILDTLKAQIPAFLHFILNREISTQKQSRMWFTTDQIYTDALQKAIEGSRTFFEKELKSIIREQLITFLPDIIEKNPNKPDEWYIAFTQKDLLEILKESQIRAGHTKLTEVLEDKWGLKYKNTTYQKYQQTSTPDGNFYASTTTVKGKRYAFTALEFLTDEEIEQGKGESNEEVLVAKNEHPPF